MASMGNVAQTADDRSHPGPERHGPGATSAAAATGAGMRVQVPRALLRSADHSALAVLVWATYETLMPRALGGGRAPAYARRVWVATKYGAGERAIDDARRELIRTDTEGGPWLRRSRVQGAKRASRHAALRLPRETGEPYVDAPAWTMDLVHAGRGRPDGTISPAAWRLYLRALDKARVPVDGQNVAAAAAAGSTTKPEGRTWETTAAEVGRTLLGGASASTARRRLRELETTGLIEVAERPGGSIVVGVYADQDAAEQSARRYAEEGRKVIAPRPDPFQLAPITPAKKLHPPLPDDSSPQKAPPLDAQPEESTSPPAVGDQAQQGAPARATAGAGNHDQLGPAAPTKPRRASAEAIDLLRNEMPRALMAQVPEHGIRRVLHALDAALADRSVAEMTDRIGKRWETWRYRTEDIQDPTAVAIAITRRPYDCPDVRCEDRTNIDTGTICGWCEQERAAHEPLNGPQGDEQTPTGPMGPDNACEALSATFTAPPVAEVLALHETADPDRTARGADLARRLLTVRSATEREEIINDQRP
ncbi:proline-rich domain-containing protein (plasmid) [Spirillospora sp. CA-255316]